MSQILSQNSWFFHYTKNITSGPSLKWLCVKFTFNYVVLAVYDMKSHKYSCQHIFELCAEKNTSFRIFVIALHSWNRTMRQTSFAWNKRLNHIFKTSSLTLSSLRRFWVWARVSQNAKVARFTLLYRQNFMRVWHLRANHKNDKDLKRHVFVAHISYLSRTICRISQWFSFPYSVWSD